jgi:hypothetical protein
MEAIHDLREISLFAMATMVVGLGPVAVALLYVWRPTERMLAYLRPVSLAAIFAALASLLSGAGSILRALASTPANAVGHGSVYAGAAEALVPMLAVFNMLTIAWLLVAVGMRRGPSV